MSALSALMSSGLDPVIVDTTIPMDADIVPMSIITTSLLPSNTGYCISATITAITNKKINKLPI
jgi:hypothetical protein